MKDVRERLIIALDVPGLAEAGALLARLRPMVQWFKVGSELFTAVGPRAVALVLDAGGRVFLDVKYHDIPHTVGRAVAAAARLGVSMLNVHAAGGEAMLHAAAAAREGTEVLLVGVTALTSLDEDPARVADQARRVQAAGLDGVVASAREATLIKKSCGERFVVVTPGIRPGNTATDDQRRTATPGEAISAGSDFLVVGRPVTAAADPLKAAQRILDEMRCAVPDPA
jgi:orotidine-5'-phosphate decarboxylase